MNGYHRSEIRPSPHRNLVMLAILMLALSVRLFRIDQNSIWLDEAWIFNGLFEPNSGYLNPFHISGLFNLSIYILSLFFNLHNELSLHLLSAVLGSASCLLVYLLCLQSGHRTFALIGAILVAVSPLHITYSQDYSVYIFSSFFITLHFYWYTRWTERFEVKYAVWFAFAGLVAINSRPQYAFFSFILILAVLFYSPFKSQLKIKSFLMASAILSLSLYTVFKAFVVTSDVGQLYSPIDLLPQLFRLYDLSMTALFNIPNDQSNFSPHGWIPKNRYDTGAILRIIFSIGFLMGLGYFIGQKNRLMITLGFGILFFVLVTGFGILKSHQFFERYLLIMQPLTVVFMVTFLSSVSQKSRRLKKIASISCLFLISYWLILSASSAYKVSWKAPNREAFETIQTYLSSDVQSAVIVPYFYEWPIARFYLHNNKNVHLPDKTFDFYTEPDKAIRLTNEAYSQLIVDQALELSRSGIDQIFVYSQRGQFTYEAISQALTGHYEKSVIYNYKGILLLRFIRYATTG